MAPQNFTWILSKFEKHCHSGILSSAKGGCTLQYIARNKFMVVNFSSCPSRPWPGKAMTEIYYKQIITYANSWDIWKYSLTLFEVMCDWKPKNWYLYWSIQKTNPDTRVRDWKAVIILQIELCIRFRFLNIHLFMALSKLPLTKLSFLQFTDITVPSQCRLPWELLKQHGMNT